MADKKTTPPKKPRGDIATRIKKGEVRNPLGSNAHNPELKALRAMTARDVAESAIQVLSTDLNELKALLHSGRIPGLQAAFISVAIKAAELGDMSRLDMLLARIIGKVPDKAEFTGANGAPLLPVRTPEERAAELANLLALRGKLKSDKQ